jgi:hypothetical protein
VAAIVVVHTVLPKRQRVLLLVGSLAGAPAQHPGTGNLGARRAPVSLSAGGAPHAAPNVLCWLGTTMTTRDKATKPIRPCMRLVPESVADFYASAEGRRAVASFTADSPVQTQAARSAR